MNERRNMGETSQGTAGGSALDNNDSNRMEPKPMNNELFNPISALGRIKSVAEWAQSRAESSGHVDTRDVDSLLNEVLFLTRLIKHEGRAISYTVTHKTEQ